MLLYLLGALALIFHQPHPLGFAAGGGLVVLGGALRGWGAGHLVKNDRLTVTGPYAYLRHPLYAGTMLLAAGFGVLLGNGPGLLVVFSIWLWLAFGYFPRKERVEGDRLEALYGRQYLAYRQAVPALWPRWVEWKPSPGGSPETRSEAVWSIERYSDNNELGTVIAVLGEPPHHPFLEVVDQSRLVRGPQMSTGPAVLPEPPHRSGGGIRGALQFDVCRGVTRR